MCTRVFNNWDSAYLATARNMDWMFILPTSLFVFEKGLKKSGLEPVSELGAIASEKTRNPLTWTSSYDSVVAMVGDDSSGWAASDGMNAMGLVANVLYDSGATYGKSVCKNKKQLSVLRWLQYVLDKFVLVKEVVDVFSKQEIQILGAEVPNSEGKTAALHLMVSDISGDSAIIEVNNGTFRIYHSADYRVVTNEPSYEEQLKINDYWLWQWSDKNSHPSHTIPGGPYSTDRFERAAFYLNHLDLPNDEHDALAQARSVAASASVPLGYNFISSASPNISNTLWTTVAAHRSQTYYFCNARTPHVAWVELANFKFESPVSAFTLISENPSGEYINSTRNGKLNKHFEPTEDPFKK
ncbi:linear amide C-N hydrolase [Pseudoalteromonas piscicida]|uniref:Choloylglycine hydrolase n=1 Tax=Pseudoalteromonas piscicida TaxID=43662 RepID=A0A2A5JTP5_PSEO7|nr:linear amide C-N hydrolase [Pseudoalteromonas piscicida]PCK32854.1 choloylglycine hydrolase [Pseudoalteromonas piscicida]